MPRDRRLCRRRICRRLRHRLKPCRDVDAVTVDIIALDDDVAEVDADAQLDAAGFGGFRIRGGQGALDGGGALDGIDHAGKLNERAIAHELDDPAMEFFDRRIDHIPAADFEECQGAGFVLAHEAAIANHIGDKDGG